MAGRTVFHGGASDFNDASIQSLRDSIFTSATSSSFLGPRSMVSFQDASGSKRSERSFFQYDQDENVDEELDEYLRQPEKKRRLTADQVLYLEKSFEVENKLEPDRKVELAKELGLQSRQIAIWFQNRRARWKTKQLEKDYESLLANYDALKADYDDLLKEKDKLKDEIASINEQLLPKEKGTTNLESSCADNGIAALSEEPRADYICQEEASKASVTALKTEELSSAKSDVLDSDSPRYNEVVHSSLFEPADSSYVFEHDQSDLSQDEEDNISKNLLRPMCLSTKNEDACYCARILLGSLLKIMPLISGDVFKVVMICLFLSGFWYCDICVLTISPI